MGRKLSSAVTGLAACVVLLLAPRAAHASSTYPGYIDTFLKLPSGSVAAVDSPSGCQLCHTDSAGGTLTLRSFGTLLQTSYGLKANLGSDAVNGILTSVAAGSDARFLNDIKAGTDPNLDSAASSSPVPQYGCGVAPGASPERFAAVGLLVLGVLAGRLRSRKRDSRSTR